MERLDNRAVHFMRLVLMTVLIMLSAFWVFGCSQSAGWSVNFGIVPIHDVDNHQKLIHK